MGILQSITVHPFSFVDSVSVGSPTDCISFIISLIMILL
nr:MAG TPA: hypothetical protein [Caudoviricetes sp.]